MDRKYFVASLFFWLTAAGFAEDTLDAEKKNSKKLLVGMDIYVANNVGAQAAFKAYDQDPSMSSSLYFYPYFKTSPFLGEREFRLQTEVSAGYEWLGKNNPLNGKIVNKLSVGDIKVRAELKKALYASNVGISLSPGLKLEAPLSKGSRDANRLIGLGGYLNFSWSKWGLFLTYKPVALGYVHSAPYKSGACSDASSSEDRLSDNTCKVSGRQNMVMVKNGVFTGYSLDSHTVTLGFRTYHQFLRAANNGEKPEEKPSSGIFESALGVVEYSYKFKTSWPTTLFVGISSLQNSYDIKQGFRMPFFDFSEAKKNQTEGYVALNVSL